MGNDLNRMRAEQAGVISIGGFDEYQEHTRKGFQPRTESFEIQKDEMTPQSPAQWFINVFHRIDCVYQPNSS